MENNENEFISRPYQVDMFQMALKENIIVYLPTGSGKTFIATMLIKELSADIRKPYSEGGKHTMFIVNKVVLVEQQTEYIARMTDLTICGLTGKDKCDFWTMSDWNEKLQSYQVFVMTAQILVNALAKGYILLNRINLIIFDECHAAVNNHPMRQIMQYFEYTSTEDHPKILGLTATLLNCNIPLTKVTSTLKALEITFHAKIVTSSILKIYHASPEESIITFDNYVVPDVGTHINHILSEIDMILKDLLLKDTLDHQKSGIEFRPKNMNQKLTFIKRNILEELSTTGIYGASKCTLLYLIQIEYIKKGERHENTVSVLEYMITQLTKCRKLLEDEMEGHTEIEKIYKYTSDKIKKLFRILKNCYTDKSTKFCCIIFVQRRYCAKLLYHILKNLSVHDEEYKFLQPEYIIGFNTKNYNTSKEDMCLQKWNNEALQRFKNGSSNCLISTDVLDEGVDIKNCSLVIRYDMPTDMRGYIQSKGRGRCKTSQYILLLPNGDASYLKKYEYYKDMEVFLQQYMVEYINENKVPTEDNIKDELYQHDIEPYVFTNEKGVDMIISELMAIQIINAYCNSLFKSKYVHLSPIWKLNEGGSPDMFQVYLELPKVTSVKTAILGDFKPSLAAAKRSAAMKMCIELHKTGELNDKLQENTMKPFLENKDYLFPNWKDECESEEIPISETYKKKRQYKLEFPKALYGAFPLPYVTQYLHILHATPNYSVPNHDNRHLVFYDLLNNNSSFGILSAKEMQAIPSFPIFMQVGELNVDVKVNHATLQLSEEEISCAKVFHTLVFNEIVPVIKPFMIFDNYNLDNCFLIVPVDEEWNINWKVIKEYKCIEYSPASIPFIFNKHDYELALVMPHYRASSNMYIVTNVCDDLTPTSSFPNNDFSTYVDYYKEKHDLVICNLMQSMLEVKTISNKMNNIIPRQISNESKKHKCSNLLKNFKEHLVPELCSRIKFPALYWLKATTLPSILHRISQLLVAEDLRHTISVETKLGLLSNNKWPPLVITDVEEEEHEETFEPLLDTSIPIEDIDNLKLESISNDLNTSVLNMEIHDYPWSQHEEPPNLYKDIEQIQPIQIEHYYQFINEEINDCKIKEINRDRFISRPTVSAVPPLQILLLENSHSPSPVQIMYALTTALAHDAFNLERLEFYGDVYLKFIVCLYLYDHFPQYNEGHLTVLKGTLVGNRNLCYCGINKHIPGRIKNDDFMPYSNFIAPAYAVFRQLQQVLLKAKVSPTVLYELRIPAKEQFKGCISSETNTMIQNKIMNWDTTESQTGMEHYLGIQSISDKTVADCVEALIGVYLQNGGIKTTVTLLKWFQILPNDVDIDELLFSASNEPIINERTIDQIIPWASDFEKKIRYKFKNRAYLLQAFTHPSYANDNAIGCYQRLEFLGDAVLDFLITSYIYEYCKNLNAGTMTDLRSALHSNITFGCLSVRYGLHTVLLSYAPLLNSSIERFVKFQEERNHIIDDELLWVLLEEPNCNIAEHVDIPKVLGDLFEALIGAIYLDCDKNLQTVWEIVYSFMHTEIHEFSKNIPKQPIRVLYETQGARPIFLKATIVEDTNMIMVPLKVFIAGKVKMFYGCGGNKKEAKRAAAKLALKSLLCKL